MRYKVSNEFDPPWWYVFFFSSYLSRRALIKSITKYASNIRGVTLDFGCGAKPYERIFRTEKYIGVDIASSGHDHQSSKVDKFYDGSRLPFADESFDSVFSSEVFEHVPNIEVIVNEINRVLKNEGKLLITVPFAIHEHEVPYDFTRFTKFGIKSLLEKSGFRVEVIESSNHYLEAVIQLFVWYLIMSIKSRNKLLTALKTFIFVLPLNILAKILTPLFPKNKSFYSNLVILAVKDRNLN